MIWFFKISFSIFFSVKCEKRGPFEPCQYEYCHTLVNEPELIDNLYCSLVCKKLDAKLKLATEKPIVQKPEEDMDLPKKPVIDRKMLLAKLKSRINKRKQSLPTFHEDNFTKPNYLGEVDNLNNDNNKSPPIPITVKQSFNRFETSEISEKPQKKRKSVLLDKSQKKIKLEPSEISEIKIECEIPEVSETNIKIEVSEIPEKSQMKRISQRPQRKRKYERSNEALINVQTVKLYYL